MHRPFRGDGRVGPPLAKQQLAAPRLEPAQVGVDRVDEADLLVDASSCRDRGRSCASRISRPGSRGSGRYRTRRRSAARRRAWRHRVAEGLSRENQFAPAVFVRRKTSRPSRAAGVRQLRRPAPSATRQRREIERALPRVVEEPFVQRVARFHDRFVHHRGLRLGHAPSGRREASIDRATPAVCMWMCRFASEPAMMPSKSSGYRCASITPCDRRSSNL